MRKGTNPEFREQPLLTGVLRYQAFSLTLLILPLRSQILKKSQDPTGIMVPTKSHPSCDSAQSNAAVASFPVMVEGPRWPWEMPGTRNTDTVSFAQCGGIWTSETYPSWMTPNSLRTLMKNIKFLHVVSRLFVANTANYQRLGSSLGFLVSYGSNPRRPFSCLLQVFLHDVPDS